MNESKAFVINWTEFLPCAHPVISSPGVRVLCEGHTVVMAESEAEAYAAMRLAFPAIKMEEGEQ